MQRTPLAAAEQRTGQGRGLDYDLTNNALGAVMNDLKREVGNNKVVIKYGL